MAVWRRTWESCSAWKMPLGESRQSSHTETLQRHCRDTVDVEASIDPTFGISMNLPRPLMPFPSLCASSPNLSSTIVQECKRLSWLPCCLQQTLHPTLSWRCNRSTFSTEEVLSGEWFWIVLSFFIMFSNFWSFLIGSCCFPSFSLLEVKSSFTQRMPSSRIPKISPRNRFATLLTRAHSVIPNE